MRSKTWLGILVAALLISLLLALGVYAYGHLHVSQDDSTDINGQSRETGLPARITAFTVEKPNLVVEGSDLERVEIWAIPTGTGVTEASYQLLGSATLRSESVAGAQVWILPIPASPVLAAEIFAKGFGANDEPTANMPLPIQGATAIHDAVWGTASISPTPPASGGASDDTQRRFSFTLAPGQKLSVGTLGVKLLQITSDSRCPQNAVCIWAGEVTARVELTLGSRQQPVELRSSGPAYTFGNYRIAIAGVFPARRTGGAPTQSSYRIEFTVERL